MSYTKWDVLFKNEMSYLKTKCPIQKSCPIQKLYVLSENEMSYSKTNVLKKPDVL
jgi:hypothetical protein